MLYVQTIATHLLMFFSYWFFSCNTSSLNATANQTTASGDDNAAIYILVVISIYVLSLAFFFIK